MPKPEKKRLLVGLGSHHGDDQVGWQLSETLGKLVSIPARQAVVPADILHWLEGIDELYLYDACQGTGPVGGLHRWDYRAEAGGLNDILDDLSVGDVTLRSTSSHQLSPAAVLRLAERLNLLPRIVVIWGVEGNRFDAGQPVSETLSRQLPDILHQLASDFTHA